jgi:tetratricopeptide (TPR) repeat protein
MRICDAVGSYGISYVPDPESSIQVVLGKPEAVDTVRFPRTTLFNHTGDCDDTAALLASLLESQGIRTAVLTSPGHIFLAFDTGEPSQNAAYLTGAKLEVLSRGGEAWIPVETTILGQGFMAAWASASELVRKYAPAGPFEMIPVRDMRESYPALPLPASSVSLVDPARGTVDAAFSASLAGFASTLYTGRIADIQAGLAGLAPRQAVKARVQMGILHALFGRVADAETAFRAALKADPTLVSPYVNLANLKIVAGDSAAALAVVTEGLSKNRDSALLNLLAARLYADRGDARSAATYLAVVKKSAPDLAEQFEQTAAGAGAGQSARAGNAAARAPVIWTGDE